MQQLANELHKPVIKKFKKRRVIVNGMNKIWAVDLVDMQDFAKENKGYKYLLTIIDIFTKYGWIVPLKNKTGKEVKNALEIIFSKNGVPPEKLWVDKGKEFYNKDVKNFLSSDESHPVEMYSTENEEKSCVVERWNRTMKEKMFRYFTANSTRNYIDVLDELVNAYNNTYHSSIKMTPVEAVELSKSGHENKIYKNLYKLFPIIKKPKYSVGDRVRISVKKPTFSKGYTPKWSEEVFTVSKIQLTDPVTYKIVDASGEEIHGTFYEAELQKTEQQVYRIEKVIKRQKNKYLVKWLGYPDTFNSWIDKKDFVRLSP